MSIKVQNLTHVYMPGTAFEQVAVKDISFEIERGEFIGLVGHTGSGKSTLIQHMIGLLKPTSGDVCVDDIDIHESSKNMIASRQKVGMVFQYPEHQLFEETVEADIAFGPKNLGLPEEEIKRRVKRAMKFVGLDYEAYRDRSPFHLSGGQMRRVAIAGVLALEPDFLILDEPTAGLDPRGRNEILFEIEKMYRETGMGVVLISHNMEDIARFSTRILVLKKGEIFLTGSPNEIFDEKAELLQGAGLNVPPLNQILHRLKKEGFAICPAEMDVKRAAADIAGFLRGEPNAE
jgi:ABC-type cobalt transport system, ATPase component